MKLVSYSAAGRASFGLVQGDGIIDAGRRLGDRYPTLRAAVAQALAQLRDLEGGAADIALADATLLPPITDPDKIICVGLNYRKHAAEAGLKVPEQPSLFLRLANTMVPHGGAMVCPRISTAFDFEGELALVIGKPGRHIAAADAMQHVLGYTCFNDGSVRDIQLKHSVTAGKNFVATGGIGPWIATSDEVPNVGDLTLTTRLNGQEVQHGRLDDLIFDVPTLIAYVSAFTPLVVGDVISTGTPEGVGFARKPPLFMKPGDAIEVEISRIGVLKNEIVAER